MCKVTEEGNSERLNLPNNKMLSLRLKKPSPLCWRGWVWARQRLGNMAPGNTKPAPSPCLLTDERDRVQKKTFTKWANKHLMKVGPLMGAPGLNLSGPPPRQLALLAAGSR